LWIIDKKLFEKVLVNNKKNKNARYIKNIAIYKLNVLFIMIYFKYRNFEEKFKGGYLK